MDKSTNPAETRRAARFHREDADRLLIECLRKKLQDPDGLHSHDGDLIPTLHIFSVYPPESYLQGKAAKQKEVLYLFSPKETQEKWGGSPSDRPVGDGFWMESSPREDFVDEQGQKIAEKRILRYHRWTMHELRLVDSQHAETSSTSEKAVKNNPSDDQDSTEVDKLTSLSPFYVLCKIFEEEAAKKQKEDESVGGGIKEEANTATRSQVGQSTSSLYIPPDDPLDSKDPADDYDEQVETESSSMESSAPAGTSRSTETTAASWPREFNPGLTTDDGSTSS